jgi:hypothetical protein
MEWEKIDLTDSSTWPPICSDVLFSDGNIVYIGWRENQDCENLTFVDARAVCKTIISTAWPENITHWMPFPKPPGESG